MILVKHEAWSHAENHYYIKEIVLHLKPAEMLIINKALRMLRQDEDVHPSDRKTADEMIKETEKRFAE